MRWFESVLGVPRFIARPALRAALWHVVFVAAVTIVKSGTNALYLARADPRKLPLLYVAVAVLVGLVTSGLARLLARSPPARVLTVGVTGAAAALLGAMLAAALHLPGATAVLYVVGEAAATSGSVLFWARVMDAFRARDQKKVVGIVGAGGMLGAAIGGLFIRAVADVVGVMLPMAVSTTAFVVALPLLRTLRTRGERVLRSDAALMPALRYLVGRGFPIAVATLVILLAALGAATDFVFRTAAAEARSETEMAALFGLLNAVVGLVVVVFQASLTSRLLARVGVFAFVGLVPMLLVGVSVAHAFFPDAFELLLLMKGVEMAGAFSLNQAAVALLYNPMPNELRSQLRTLIDGAVKKSGGAAAGLVLAALAAFMPFLVGSWLVALTAAATLVLLPLLRARYLAALDDKLGQTRKIRPGTIDPSDKVTQQGLRSALLIDDADVVLAALAALGPSYVLAPMELGALMEHADERVRTAALQHVPATADAALTARLFEIARGRGPRRPRAEAVRALARLQGRNAALVVQPFLHDDEPGVVVAAIEASLAAGESSAARARLDELIAHLADHPLAWRRELAHVLGALGDTRYDSALARLITDADPTVRTVAVAAAGRERHSAHLPLLVAHLGDRGVRRQAMEALAAYGDEALEILSTALDDRTLPLLVRIHVPRVLESIGTEGAARALLFSNPRDDAYLQQRIAASLVRIAASAPGIGIDAQRTDEAIGRRLVAFSAYEEARLDLDEEDAPAFSMLKRTVRDRCHQNLRIALDLLGLHRGLERMQTVFAGLTSGREAARQDAIELLDAALAGDPLRADFLSLLERHVARRDAGAARRRVASLCGSRDPLLRGVARHTAMRLGDLDRAQLPAQTSVGPGALELEGDDMSEHLVERLLLLEHVDLFEGLATDDLAAIASIATELTLQPGAFLYREGEKGTQLYVIIEGDVTLTRAGQPVMTLHAGESAGQVSFLDRGPRPLTARVSAQHPARFLVVERDAFMDLLADRPGLMHAFFGVLAARIRTLIEGEVSQGKVTRRPRPVPTSV